MSENTVRKIGRYEIEREIGQGGMAVVYQALDPRLGRSVAIKLIKRDAFAPSYFGMILERFKREAMALARLDHPNIVKILDYGEHEGAPYLVMNYISGTTLRDIRKPIRVETAVKLLRPIVEALDYVHEQGLVHRDIKPSNIMLTRQNHVILTDFGIAKWIDDDNELATLTGTGVGIGTPEYMAPEQGRGAKLDGRSDLYSLSVIFYELITGVKPFQGATPVDILVRQATEPVPDPRTIVPGISPSIKRFLDRAMAKNPDDRYPTTVDFLRDFDGLRLEAIAQASNSGTNPSGIRTIDRGSGAPSSGSSVQIKQSDVERVRQASAQTPETEPSRKKRSPWIAALVGVPLAAALIFGGLYLRTNQAQKREMAVKTEEARLLVMDASSYEEQLELVKKTFEFEFGLTQTQEALLNPSATPLLPTDTATPTASQTAIRAQDLTATQDAAIAAAQQKVEKIVSYAQTQAQATTEQARHAATEQTETEAAIYALGLTERAKAATETAIFVQAQTQTAQALVPTAEPNPYASLKIGDIITFGRYEQDNNFENGKEPIEWEVLDVGNGSAVLISRYGLECRAYDYNNGLRTVTWKGSYLNRYFLPEFFTGSFSIAETEFILKSELNSNGIYKAAVDEANGVDVFILGKDEISKYFAENDTLQAEPSKYTAANGAWVGTNGKVWWWVREDAETESVPVIDPDGSMKDPGLDVGYEGIAVRPVIRIRTSDVPVSELPPLSERIRDLKNGDRVLLGEFFQDTSYLNGMEPIEWRVLDVADGSALLLSEYLLTSKWYHEKWEDVTWEKSSLRRWLNEDFFENVFSEEEKNVIVLSKLPNPRNPKYGTPGGSDTQDYVFLLSIEESERYLPTREERIAKPTGYAIGHGSWLDRRNRGGWWWLRSPGYDQGRAAGVDSDGVVGIDGIDVYFYVGSVRPALRIKLK